MPTVAVVAEHTWVFGARGGRWRLHQASDNRPPLTRSVFVEISQAPEGVHHSLHVGGLPARINAELGHSRSVEAGGCFRLEFRAAQRLADLGHFCGIEVLEIETKHLILGMHLKYLHYFGNESIESIRGNSSLST